MRNILTIISLVVVATGCTTSKPEDTTTVAIDRSPQYAAPINTTPSYVNTNYSSTPSYVNTNYSSPQYSSTGYYAPVVTTSASNSGGVDSQGSQPFFDAGRSYSPPPPSSSGYSSRTYTTSTPAPIRVEVKTPSTPYIAPVVTTPDITTDESERWTSHSDVSFAFNSSELSAAQLERIKEIAVYMDENSYLTVGLDASRPTTGVEGVNQTLTEGRISAVKEALIDAGVATTRIQSGKFGNPDLRQDSTVEVLIVGTSHWGTALMAR